MKLHFQSSSNDDCWVQVNEVFNEKARSAAAMAAMARFTSKGLHFVLKLINSSCDLIMWSVLVELTMLS